jgi:glycosyltransferase involved in cell wall biosynthesis
VRTISEVGEVKEMERTASAKERSIACLIPVYNDRSQLNGTLGSLAGQDVDLTVVIVDDGSNPPLSVDTTRFDFPIVLLRLPSNGGIERALNSGLQYITQAGFDYVARLDNGDLCKPSRLRIQRDYLDDHPEIALVGSYVEWMTAPDAVAFRMEYPTEHDDIVRWMHRISCLSHPTVMFRTEIVAQVGDYPVEYPAAEDYEYFWRIAHRFQVANIPSVLVQTQLDPAGISLSRRKQQLRSRLRIQAKYFSIRDPYSYVGFAKTLLLFVTPNSWVIRLKRVLFPGRSS